MSYRFVVRLVDPLTNRPVWEGLADDLLAANEGFKEIHSALELLNEKNAGGTLLLLGFSLLRVD